MASRERRSDTKKGGAASSSKALSPDDFERLASIFRPSWKLDEAPITAGATFSQDEVRSLQGGAPQQLPRVGALTLNGVHPAAALSLDQAPITALARTPAAPTIPADAVPAAPPRPSSSSPPVSEAGGEQAPSAPDALPPAQRPTVPSFTGEALQSVPPGQTPAVPSWIEEGSRSPFSPPAIIPAEPWGSSRSSSAARTEIRRRGSPSRKPMWLGLGFAGIVAGLGLWLWNAAGAHTAPPPVPPSIAKVIPEPTPPVPPAAQVSAAPIAQPVAPSPQSPPAEPPPTKLAPAPAAPVIEPAPQQVAQPATPSAPKPTPAPKPAPEPVAPPVAAAPAPKPFAKAKPATQTIVHDVPF
jgi:hypothetical protein